jgi:hypothetical protein
MAGDVEGAAGLFGQVVQDYPATTAAAQARGALKEVGPLVTLRDALALGAHGNTAAMNARLRDLARQAPGTLAADEVPATPELVSGTILDSNGASVAGDRVIFLAFGTAAPARGFTFDFNHDGSVFKVAGTIRQGGEFAVRLPAGYWYVATWDDPAWSGTGYFNAPMANGNDAFAVAPFTPVNVGTIVGY